MGLIREIDKGRGEVIRVEVSEYKGIKYLNLRVWYTDKRRGKKNRLRKESQSLRNSTTKSKKRSSKQKTK